MSLPILFRTIAILLLLAFVPFWPITALAGPILSHGSGDAALSADGRYLAFYTLGMPENIFFVTDFETGESWKYELPDNHHEVGDLVWTRQGHGLLFVSSKKHENPRAQAHLYRYGSHVWRVQFEPEVGAQPAEILAEDVGVRRPVLSPDQSQLSYFALRGPEGEMPEDREGFGGTRGIVEKTLPTGEARLVAPARIGPLWNLFYAGPDQWLFSTREPKYRRTLENGRVYWGHQAAPPRSGTFNQKTNGIVSFRIARGDDLPEYPDFLRPFPSMEVVLLKAMLMGQTVEGHPILLGAPGDENTSFNQLRNTLSWYQDSLSPVEMDMAYLVYDGDTLIDAWPVPSSPDGYRLNVGGTDIDAGLQYFASVKMSDNIAKRYVYSDHRNDFKVFLIGRDGSKFERFVHDIAANAEFVKLETDE